MNPDPHRPLPNFRTLYWADYTIRRSIMATVMGLFLAAGIWWASRPMPNAVPLDEPSFETMYAPYVIAGGGVLAVIGALIFFQRYALVRKILSEGNSIQGTAFEVDIFETNQNSHSSTNRFAKTYAYYTSIRYELHGVERKARFKLLHSPSTFGIRKDGAVELLVLDQAPKKPLIRAVYTERPRIGKR